MNRNLSNSAIEQLFDIVFMVRASDTPYLNNNYYNARIIHVSLQNAKGESSCFLERHNVTLVVSRSEDTHARSANITRENFTKELNVRF